MPLNASFLGFGGSFRQLFRVACHGLCTAGLLCLAFVGAAQTPATNATENATGLDAVFGEGVDVVLSEAARFHVMLHTQGAGIGFQRGKYDGAMRIRGWQMELAFVRHLKEEKTRNPVYEEALAYVYGKVNAHHVLRVQHFTQTLLFEKYRKGGVTVSRLGQWGVAVGVSKPVYLEIGYPEIPYTSLQVERYDPEVHFSNRIYGRAPWVNGLESLGFNPGLSAGQALTFEFNDTRSATRTLDLGAGADVYLRPVEIMAADFVTARRVHLTFYLRYAWGAQWSSKGLDDAGL